MPLLDDSLTTTLGNIPVEEMQGQLVLTLQGFVDQINGAPQVYTALNPAGALPNGMKAGDILAGFNSSNQPQFGIFDGTNVLVNSAQATMQQMGYVGSTSGSGAPTTDQFPSDGTWGYYTDTGSSNTYIARNVGGSILKTQLT